MRIAIVNWKGVNPHGHFQEYLNLFQKFISDFQGEETLILNLETKADTIKRLDLLRHFIEEYSIEHIFFPWFHDIQDCWSEIDQAIGSKVTYSGLGALSHAVRKSKGISSRVSKKNANLLIKNLDKYAKAIGCLTWDPKVHNLYGEKLNLELLPDVQDLSQGEIPEYIQDLFANSNSKRIGLLGQLYVYRGIQYLYSLAKRNPNYNFFAIGERRNFGLGLKKLYDNFFWKRLISLPNVYVHSSYIPKSSDLNAVISSMDLIVLDTRSYPNPSGIVTRARAFGVPTILSSKNSALFDLFEGDDGLHLLKPFSKIPRDYFYNKVIFVPSEKDFKISIFNFFTKMESIHEKK